MPRVSQMIVVLVAAIAMFALAACQNNTAGKPGYVPTNCSAPGSTCSR